MNPEEEEAYFDKCVGQFRLAVGTITAPLRLYGQGLWVDKVNEEVVSLAIQLHYKLSGLDIPYHINKDVLS